MISVLKLKNEQEAGTSSRSDHHQQLVEKKTLLAELVKEHAAVAMVHLRMSTIQLETPNKEFFNLEKAVKTSRQIHSLHSSDGVLTCQSDMKHSMQDFDSNLFSPRTVDKTITNEVIELLQSLS